ncbi:hypothetical protein FQA39_LY12732 [Lamprigera yunnana]|nr:hypothetical protein FQA39_LY12732 [Lamprigera yunnana]
MFGGVSEYADQNNSARSFTLSLSEATVDAVTDIGEQLICSITLGELMEITVTAPNGWGMHKRLCVGNPLINVFFHFIAIFDQETLGENRENLETSEKNSALCISPIPGPSTRPITPSIPTECNTSDQRDNKAERYFAITPADCNPLPNITGKRAAQKRKSVGTVILTS